MGNVKISKYVSMAALALTISLGTLPINSLSPTSALAAKQESASFFNNFRISSSGSTYTLEFTTNSLVNVQVSYALKDNKNMTSISSLKASKNHKYTLEGLSANSQYTAVVTVIGEKATQSETISFDTSGQQKVTVLSEQVSYVNRGPEIQIETHEGYESEYNGEFVYANNMYPATNYFGRIACGSSDNDYFKIDISGAKTAGKLNVFLDVPSNKDYELYLYNASGTAVANSLGGTGIDELISQTGISAGIYYARVLGYNSSCDDSINYSLRWKFYPDLAWPVPGSNHISSGYKDPNRTPVHMGTDISFNNSQWLSSWNYEIQAVKTGSVVDKADYDSLRGNTVTIDHNYINGTRIYARYLHFELPALVSIGNSVSQSQRIGWMGNTGDSNGKHLHIDFNTASSPYPSSDYRYDPMTYLTKPHDNEIYDYWEANSYYKTSK